ncbi:MAG: EthD family reductase [Acetobacteraceae bacterium]
MIKVVGLLTRKPELTHAQFVQHWLEVHGPLAHAVPGVRRYVQSHIIGTRTRLDIPETDVEVDGIAELWYDDEAALVACGGVAGDEAADRRWRIVHRPHQVVHRAGEADQSPCSGIARRRTGHRNSSHFRFAGALSRGTSQAPAHWPDWQP